MSSTAHPYLPNTDADRRAMLDAIGVKRFEDLVADIPAEHLSPELALPSQLSEQQLASHLKQLAAVNQDVYSNACFLGGGARSHYIPSVVQSIISRGEFLTSYTPYQSEVAQGTLQAGFDFQSLVSELFEMDVANLGMYDGATAFAEAHLMACRVTRRRKIAILDTVDRRIVEVLQSYTEWQDLEIVIVKDGDELPDDVASVGVQSPDMFGALQPVGEWSRRVHEKGGLSVAMVDPTCVAMFATPGSQDVDIAVAEGQPLGVPLSFGGAYIGLFACKERFMRQMPGRIAGYTTDAKGRTAYTLTLQTREQHIRRSKATSNICTSTQLIALMVTVYLAVLGPHNLQKVANICYQNAHYLSSEITQLPGYRLITEGTFFNEFAVKCPIAPAELNRQLAERGIIGGLDISETVKNGMLLCATEMNSREQIDRLVAALREIQG